MADSGVIGHPASRVVIPESGPLDSTPVVAMRIKRSLASIAAGAIAATIYVVTAAASNSGWSREELHLTVVLGAWSACVAWLMMSIIARSRRY